MAGGTSPNAVELLEIAGEVLISTAAPEIPPEVFQLPLRLAPVDSATIAAGEGNSPVKNLFCSYCYFVFYSLCSIRGLVFCL